MLGPAETRSGQGKQGGKQEPLALPLWGPQVQLPPPGPTDPPCTDPVLGPQILRSISPSPIECPQALQSPKVPTDLQAQALLPPEPQIQPQHPQPPCPEPGPARALPLPETPVPRNRSPLRALQPPPGTPDPWARIPPAGPAPPVPPPVPRGSGALQRRRRGGDGPGQPGRVCLARIPPACTVRSPRAAPRPRRPGPAPAPAAGPARISRRAAAASASGSARPRGSSGSGAPRARGAERERSGAERRRGRRSAMGEFEVHRVRFFGLVPAGVRCLACHPRGTRLALARTDGAVEVYNFAANYFQEKVRPPYRHVPGCTEPHRALSSLYRARTDPVRGLLGPSDRHQACTGPVPSLTGPCRAGTRLTWPDGSAPGLYQACVEPHRGCTGPVSSLTGAVPGLCRASLRLYRALSGPAHPYRVVPGGPGAAA